MDAEASSAPLTPGQLQSALGLSSGATTSVVDRLERQGHARRNRDTVDRRRIHLHFSDSAHTVARQFFGPLGRLSTQVMDQFTDAELEVVQRFLTGIVDAYIAAADTVEAHTPPGQLNGRRGRGPAARTGVVPHPPAAPVRRRAAAQPGGGVSGRSPGDGRGASASAASVRPRSAYDDPLRSSTLGRNHSTTNATTMTPDPMRNTRSIASEKPTRNGRARRGSSCWMNEESFSALSNAPPLPPDCARPAAPR